MFGRNILSSVAVEIGASRTRVFQKNMGEIFSAPTLIAFRRGRPRTDSNIVCIGEDAHPLIGRAPTSVEVVRPVANGAIVDTEATVLYINRIMSQAIPGFWVAKPRIICAVPSASTLVTRTAFSEVFRNLGCTDVKMVPQHLAVLAGCGVDFTKRGGTLIVNMGAGSTDVAITSFGATVANTSIKIGGDEMNRYIQEFFRRSRKIDIGDATVEHVKKEIGCAIYSDNYGTIKTTIRAKCLETRRSVAVDISKNDIAEAIKPVLERISDRIFDAFECVSPEIASDVLSGCAFLSGGVARMESIQDYFRSTTAVQFQNLGSQQSLISSGLLNILAQPRSFSSYCG